MQTRGSFKVKRHNYLNEMILLVVNKMPAWRKYRTSEGPCWVLRRARVDVFGDLIHGDYLNGGAFGSHRITEDAIEASTIVIPLFKFPP